MNDRQRQLISLFATGMALLAGPGRAQDTFGDVATTVTGQIGAFGQLAGAASALIGVVLAITGMLKFRGYSQNPQDPGSRLGAAIGFVLAGACLVAIPEFLDVGITSFFGDQATQTNFSGANLLN